MFATLQPVVNHADVDVFKREYAVAAIAILVQPVTIKSKFKLCFLKSFFLCKTLSEVTTVSARNCKRRQSEVSLFINITYL